MLSIFFIGLAVSMDAFSLSISIGTTNINNRQKRTLAMFIAIMHFIMPQIGLLFGYQIFRILPINIIIFNIIIFIYLGIIMLIKKADNQSCFKYSLLNSFILAIGVSIDSFSIGLGLDAITRHYYIAGLIFASLSGVISYIGLLLGERILYLFKERARILGAILLFILAIVNLIKLL